MLFAGTSIGQPQTDHVKREGKRATRKALGTQNLGEHGLPPPQILPVLIFHYSAVLEKARWGFLGPGPSQNKKNEKPKPMAMAMLMPILIGTF